MKVPVVVMRGGTSKGVFLNFEHMPIKSLTLGRFLT